MTDNNYPWVEEYRPHEIEDVIGISDNVETFKKYIEEKSIPNLLFMGGAGVGKCVSYDTEIEIEVDDETYKLLKKYEIL